VIAGGCRCGAVRYTLAVERVDAVYCCHCTDCQRWSGSAFSEQAVVPDGVISAEGPVIEFVVTTPSGAESRQRACGVCHGRLWNTNSSRPGIATVRAGTLDHNRELAPRAHIWVKSKQPWLALPEGVPAFDETPPMHVFAAALTK
jgi:hypothetical protein